MRKKNNSTQITTAIFVAVVIILGFLNLSIHLSYSLLFIICVFNFYTIGQSSYRYYHGVINFYNLSVFPISRLRKTFILLKFTLLSPIGYMFLFSVSIVLISGNINLQFFLLSILMAISYIVSMALVYSFIYYHPWLYKLLQGIASMLLYLPMLLFSYEYIGKYNSLSTLDKMALSNIDFIWGLMLSLILLLFLFLYQKSKRVSLGYTYKNTILVAKE